MHASHAFACACDVHGVRPRNMACAATDARHERDEGQRHDAHPGPDPSHNVEPRKRLAAQWERWWLHKAAAPQSEAIGERRVAGMVARGGDSQKHAKK